MGQKKETATSFDRLREIAQAIQARKNSAQINDNANTSGEITSQSMPKYNGNSAQINDNANTSGEITSQSMPKYNGTLHAKNIALRPTKKAFSERQKTTIRDNSQANAKEIKRGN